MQPLFWVVNEDEDGGFNLNVIQWGSKESSSVSQILETEGNKRLYASPPNQIGTIINNK